LACKRTNKTKSYISRSDVIEDSKEDNIVEQHFMQKDVGEENIVEPKIQLSIEVHVEVQQSIEV
jgi:hypothetical protein